MRELELRKVYLLKDQDGQHIQKVVFSTEESPEGTCPLEVLNALIEKIYGDQFASFSCEKATAVEFLKSARRILTKNSVKIKGNEYKKY
jgi:hypothetical protein